MVSKSFFFFFKCFLVASMLKSVLYFELFANRFEKKCVFDFG